MGIESLQTLSQIFALVGLVATAVDGFGSYYSGDRADEARAEDFRTRLDGLSEDGKALAVRLEPFYELARADTWRMRSATPSSLVAITSSAMSKSSRQTAIGSLIGGCGSYPSSSKSSIV